MGQSARILPVYMLNLDNNVPKTRPRLFTPKLTKVMKVSLTKKNNNVSKQIKCAHIKSRK